jgi:SAM-dependent methyltransferase
MYNDIAEIYLEIFSLNRAFLRFIPDYLGNPQSRVLDLGCGPGDYVDRLTRDGFVGVGIDNSKGMIDRAQKQKRGTFYHLSFTEIHQLEEDISSSFDCAYCIGNSLSYLPNDGLQPFLNSLRRLLKPSGNFIIQVVNWDKFLKLQTADFPVKTISGGRTFHRRYEWIKPSQVIFQTEIQKNGKTLNSWSDPIYPKYVDPLVRDLEESGLKVLQKFGEYDRSAFDPQSSPALILAAQKWDSLGV